MEIIKHDSYLVLKPKSAKIVNKKELILNFYKEFSENFSNFKNKSLILDFSDDINIDLKEILLFSQKSSEHKKNNYSFVMVCKGVDIDALPNEMIVVPTLKEAEDIIEIEDIERDLGI